MKNYSSLSYEDRVLFLTQCYEARYNFEACAFKCDLLENLRTGYSADPDWFQVRIDEDDWSDVFDKYAAVLASSLDFDVDFNDFEKKFKMSVFEAAAKYILDFHSEGLEFDAEDIIFYVEDLSTKEK